MQFTVKVTYMESKDRGNYWVQVQVREGVTLRDADRGVWSSTNKGVLVWGVCLAYEEKLPMCFWYVCFSFVDHTSVKFLKCIMKIYTIADSVFFFLFCTS